MALVSSLKKIKKKRSDTLLMAYEANTGLLKIWNDEVYIQYVEKEAIGISFHCTFNDLWEKIKNCKSKDSIKLERVPGFYNVVINNKNVGQIPQVQEEVPFFTSVKENKLMSSSGKNNLLEIVKKLDKQILNIDLYDSLQYMHCKDGSLYVNNLVSIERYLPSYLEDVQVHKKYGFSADFSCYPVYFKNIELLSSKDMEVFEYKSRIAFLDDINNIIVMIRKHPLYYDYQLSKEINGNPLPISWNINIDGARKLLKESLSSTDKSIQCVVSTNKGKLCVGAEQVGEIAVSDDDIVFSFREALEGFNKEWFMTDNLFYFNYDKSGQHQKIFLKYNPKGGI